MLAGAGAGTAQLPNALVLRSSQVESGRDGLQLLTQCRE